MIGKFAGLLQVWITIPIKSGLVFWIAGLLAYLNDTGIITWDNLKKLDVSANGLILTVLGLLLLTLSGYGFIFFD